MSWACTRGEEDIVRFLVLEAGINLYAKTTADQNVLMNACTNGSVAVIRFLIALGIDANTVKQAWNYINYYFKCYLAKYMLLL